MPKERIEKLFGCTISMEGNTANVSNHLNDDKLALYAIIYSSFREVYTINLFQERG